MSEATLKPSHLERDWSLDVHADAEQQRMIFGATLGGLPALVVPGAHLNVLLCALPKSAGLYTTQLLAACLGLRNHQIGFNRAGGALYYPRLLAAKFTPAPTISHCHETPHGELLGHLENLSLRPIVQTRNLLDALVSRRDMMLVHGGGRSLPHPVAMDRFRNATSEEQMDTTIDLFASGFMSWYATWKLFQGDPKVRPIYTTYEELVADEVAFVLRVARDLGLQVTETHVATTIDEIRAEGGINFNRGVSGRGRQEITDEQLDRLASLARRTGCTDEDFLGFALS